jgi:2,4-dienoyl-CoA reductase-like NADH-dependent reductase (Old Yellow Enzyme family)
VIANLAEGIKKAVTIPVIAVGKITLEAGDRILKEGKADFLAIGRALLADPEHINKVASGNLEDITPCIECSECFDSMMTQTPTGIRCPVNASLGKEGE